MRKQILALVLAISSILSVPTYAATVTAGAEQASTTEQKSEASSEGINWIIDPSTPGYKLVQPYGTSDWWQAEAVEQAKKWAEDHKGNIASIAGERARYEAVAKEVCDFLTYDETHNYANAHIAYTIRDGKGVCSDYTTLGKALCDITGVTAKVSAGAAGGLGHDMLKVTLDGVEYYSDLSSHDLYGTALLSVSKPSSYIEDAVWDRLYDAAVHTGDCWKEDSLEVAQVNASKTGKVVLCSNTHGIYYSTPEDKAIADKALAEDDDATLFAIWDKYGVPYIK